MNNKKFKSAQSSSSVSPRMAVFSGAFLRLWIAFLFSVALFTNSSSKAENEGKALTKSELEDIQAILGETSNTFQDVAKQLAELKTLKEKATGGDSEAQCSLGIQYLRGQEWIKQDFKEARYWLEKSATQGNGRANFFLGAMSESGRGAPKDYKLAVEFYQRGATNGNSWAQWGLGGAYEDGRGVKKNTRQALRWYSESAKNGNRVAQYNLGIVYYNGIFVRKDIAVGVKWYQKSADQGYASAQENLAIIYMFTGDSGETNCAKGAKLLLESAGQGNPSAQHRLSGCFYTGTVFPQDFAEAYKWGLIAKAHGSDKAEDRLKVIESTKGVTNETLAEGRNRARAYGIRSPRKLVGDD